MQPLDLAWFSRLGVSLQPLCEGGLEDHSTALQTLRGCFTYLVFLGDESRLPLSLAASRQIIWGLMEATAEILNETDPSTQITLIDKHKTALYDAGRKLRTLLDADLAHQLVFLLEPKRAYNVKILMTDGTRLFSDHVKDNLTEEERYNIVEGAKCLAFEIPTGAAFHIFRAAESALRRYYEALVGTLPQVKARNWGAYIEMLKQQPKADAKVLVLLQQVKDLYRNPIIHPETRLSMDEALSLVGIAETLISLVVADLQRHKGSPPALPPPTKNSKGQPRKGRNVTVRSKRT